MDAFELPQLIYEQRQAGRPYLEFLRASSLSVGLYTLAAGAVDSQPPHTEDEVYCVIRGRAVIQVAGEARQVQAGSVVFVAANVEHRFHTIEEDLNVLVFFAPPEGACS